MAKFFERLVADGEAAAFCLPGGATLFEAGETSTCLYFLRTGRLAAHIGDVRPRVVTIHPGETVGEMAVIAGATHSAHVFALRDSELISAPREVFFDRLRADPDLLIELSRLVLARSRETVSDEPPIARRVFAVIALTASVDARTLAESIGEALQRLGHSSTALGASDGPATPDWFSRTESHNDFVLYAVRHDEPVWRALVARQVDGVFVVANGADRPQDQPAASTLGPWSVPGDLILIQEPNLHTPRGAAEWVAAVTPERLFHIRAGGRGDIDRLARVLAGRAVGLVLSGGAARAYAHVGAVQVLREARVPVDFLGGVSMGAIVGAGVAMGWDDAEMDDRIRKAFVSSSPINDFTFPIVSIARGDTVRERLEEHFGDRTICDLWLPFFCVSTNLTAGAQQIHRQGLLREALRASLSVPGVLPPVTYGDDVLVDGAVLNNFPADIMRGVHNGPIVGVDVSQGRSIGASEIEGPASTFQWLSSGAWRDGAPIVSLLVRAATVTARHQMASAHEVTDVLIQPKLDEIEIADWRAYEPAVAAGRRATLDALDALDRPVTDLRHGVVPPSH
jgi:NTE family protein